MHFCSLEDPRALLAVIYCLKHVGFPIYFFQFLLLSSKSATSYPLRTAMLFLLNFFTSYYYIQSNSPFQSV